MEPVKTETDIQIRFADVDILGHVNNVNQQHYFDLGKSDYYKGVLGLRSLIWKTGIITAATETSYFGQVRPDERVYVETGVEKVGNKSMVFLQRLISRDTGEVKTESRSVMVAFDFEAQESVPVPEEWKPKMGFAL